MVDFKVLNKSIEPFGRALLLLIAG